ncbi:MAG: type III-B CRISPR module-associated protein Cmr5 [bacterium]
MRGIKTLNQERASFALEQLRDNKSNDKYKITAKKLPSLIVSNGLIPTLAYLRAKDDRRDVYYTLNIWLKKKKFIKENEDALESLVNSDFSKLRLATMEVLELANWLKRASEIET